MFDALECCTQIGEDAYEVDPHVMYPTVVAFLQAHQVQVQEIAAMPMAERVKLALSGDALAGFCVQAESRMWTAAHMDPSAWALALQPRDEVREADVALRALALEEARLWFVRALKEAAGAEGMIYLHICKGNGAFRL